MSCRPLSLSHAPYFQMAFACSLACALLISTVGCERTKAVNKTPYQPLTLAAAQPHPPADAAAGTITKAEAEAFAAKWIQAIGANDDVAVGKLVDFQQIFSRSLDGLVDSEEFRRGFLKGSSSAATNFVRSISPLITREGNFVACQ